MFVTATYKVRADENDFPQVGQIINGYYDGVVVSTVVREIQKVAWFNPDWKEKNELPIVNIQLLVQVDEEQLARQKRKQQLMAENKLVIFDGGNNGKSDKENN